MQAVAADVDARMMLSLAALFVFLRRRPEAVLDRADECGCLEAARRAR